MTSKPLSISLKMLPVYAIVLISSNLAMAQIGGAGSIQGIISDSSGAVIPGASVVATNVATGVKISRQTTAAGLYVLSPLPPGEYSVSVSATGFQSLVQGKVIVDALSTVGLNLALQVGATTETINVEAAPPQLNTADARLGTTVRNELYTALPLSMGISGIGAGPRNPGAFIYLLPGVQEGNRWGMINGAQGFSKDVFVEGVPITDAIQQGEGRSINLGFSVDAIEQFQVETSGTGVEYNGQGSENYVIKSGTNQFHGSVFEYFRNTVLDARPFFSPTRPKENQNEFGGTIGGPIIKNKVFFFFVYDGWRYRIQTDARFVTVPTLKMRQGDFSELPVQIYDPRTTVPLPGGGFSRQPFQGNIIPPDRISPISKFFQTELPLPTHPGIQNNYLGQLPVGYNNNNYTVKVDINLTESHRLSTLFTRGKRSQSGPYREVTVPLPLPYTNTRFVEEIPTVAQVKYNWTVTPTLLNQVSFGFNRLFVPIDNVTVEGKWTERAGLRGLPPGEARDSFPETLFAGTNAPTNWRGTDARDFLDANNNFTFQDSLQWVRGNHALKFGFQHQRLHDNFRARDTGTLFVANFTNTQTAGFGPTGTLLTNTGNAYATYLLGAVNSATVNDDFFVGVGARYYNYAWWVQDDFKVTPRLTLNLGLRYDIMEPYKEVADRFSFLDPDFPNPAAGGRPGALRFGGDYAPDAISCNCRTPVKTYFGALGPRVGLAYSLNDKTVIRGGYGIMYTRRGAVGGREGARDGTGTLGFNASAPLNSPDNGISPAFYWDNGIPPYQKGPIYDATYLTGFNAPGSVGGTLTFGNPESQPPRYQNWNLSIQRSITPSLSVTVAYSGSNGKYLAGAGRGIWSNQIHPRYLVLGNLLQSQATAANVAAARAILPDVSLPFPSFQGTIAQMLRPFPQYSGVGDPYGNVGQSNYNALQFVVQKRLSAGLTLNVNYTFSKAISDVNGGRTAYFWEQEKSLSSSDQPHIFNAFFAYDLPFGKGRAFDPGIPLVRGIISGWRISGITRYASGTPFGVMAAACNVPQAGTCFANYNPNFSGPVRINGDWGNGDLLGPNPPSFIDRNAFVSPAAFSYGNTPPTHAHGLRVPHLFNQDVSVTRDFRIRENLRFEFGADAFNVFNNVRFGNIGTTITNANFGRITAQVNTPRAVQFKARLAF
jgi:Carboxypeptidase regulatory-like domain